MQEDRSAYEMLPEEDPERPHPMLDMDRGRFIAVWVQAHGQLKAQVKHMDEFGDLL